MRNFARQHQVRAVELHQRSDDADKFLTFAQIHAQKFQKFRRADENVERSTEDADVDTGVGLAFGD